MRFARARGTKFREEGQSCSAHRPPAADFMFEWELKVVVSSELTVRNVQEIHHSRCFGAGKSCAAVALASAARLKLFWEAGICRK